jgi:hypothetical protein
LNLDELWLSGDPQAVWGPALSLHTAWIQSSMCYSK